VAPVRRRLARIALWLGAVALLLGLLELLGVPAFDWIGDLVDKVGDVPPWAVVAGVALESAQTSLAANLGTFVMLVMFTTLIAGATFPLVFSGLIVEKIPFSVFNVALYLYLFLSVSGSFSIKLGFLADHTGLVILLVIGAIVLIVLLARIFWERLAKLRQQLISGGAILRSPHRTATRLFLPVLGSYAARLAIVAVFLGAYSIPVTFENVATVTASNSVSNSVSATPGGVGVTQAMNSAALSGSTSAKTATAYSIGQQLIISAWDVIFAIILVSWVFGWSGGKELVESSYGEAKVKSRELRSRKQHSDANA
jgi:uncharacterized membrane protein YbhN (UPF0104 family)